MDTMCGQWDGFPLALQPFFQGSEAFIWKYFVELMQYSWHKNTSSNDRAANPPVVKFSKQ